MNYTQILTADMLVNPDSIILYEITKSEIVKRDFERINQLFTLLNKCKKSATGKIKLHISGYDRDNREIYEIGEVNSFMKILFDKYPYFLYYVINDDSIKAIYLYCIIDVTVINRSVCGVNVKPKSTIRSDEIVNKIINETIKYGQSINDELGAMESIKFLIN